MKSTLVSALVWALFFGMSAFGHVALKVAVDARGAGGKLALAMVSPLALAAYASWGVSALLWAVALSRHSLLSANALSALRYAVVAACAVLFLGEPLGARRVLGAALIGLGVLLVA